MDNLAHTLIGAALGETRLNRLTPLARTTLIAASNLPDVDGVCSFVDRDLMLGCRRGHTHGVLAMLLLPVALTLVVTLWDRFVRRRSGKAPIDAKWTFVLAFIGVLSHPLLDWLNTYGVRLLMPFSGEWFYGDALFIIDPWLWLLAAAAAVAGNSQTWRSKSAWIVLAGLTSMIVVGTPLVPLPAKAAWICGIGIIITLRVWGPGPERIPRLAVSSLSLLAVYIGAMVFGSALARNQARDWYREQGVEVETVMAGPVPAQPFKRDVIARANGTYHFAELDWFQTPAVRESRPKVPVNDGPVPRAALEKRPGLKTWIRFPAFQAVPIAGGYEVRIRDVRYDRQGRGLGEDTVRIVSP